MKHIIIAVTVLIFSIGLAGCISGQYTQTGMHRSAPADTLRMMKAGDVIALSKAGVSDSLIIYTMDATGSWFNLKAQDVIDLRNAGVSEKVISAMLQQPEEQSADSNRTIYYVYPDRWSWYDGYYPYWYHPSFVFGHRFYHHGFAHHGRIH